MNENLSLRGGEPKRLEKACLRGASVLCAAAFVFSAVACQKDNSVSEGKLLDFYGEAEFTLPFECDNFSKTDALNFNTDLSMEQMTEKVKSAGYGAVLYDFDGVKRTLITSEKNGCDYYFLIYDKSYSGAIGNGESDRYTLGELSESVRAGDSLYAFLFPLHFAEISAAQNGAGADGAQSRKMHCTFNEFADFYRNSGKDDALIDEENKTVTFACKASAEHNGTNVNWSAGDVLLSYSETEIGNFVEMRLK